MRIDKIARPSFNYDYIMRRAGSGKQKRQVSRDVAGRNLNKSCLGDIYPINLVTPFRVLLRPELSDSNFGFAEWPMRTAAPFGTRCESTESLNLGDCKPLSLKALLVD